jgi:hypothetical protein
MRQTLAVVLVTASLTGAGPALAADDGARRELSAPRRGYAVEPAPLGLRLITPAFGLRLEFEPPAKILEPRPVAPTYESPFRAGPDQALRFWSADLGQGQGWSAFGAYGTMRLSKDFYGDSDTTLRFGSRQDGAPGASERLDLGIRYRFRF